MGILHVASRNETEAAAFCGMDFWLPCELLRVSRSAEDFTKVTFYPDLKRFGMAKLDKAALQRY